MALKTRTEQIDIKDTVQLTATFKNELGVATDLDAFPQITITTPSGLISVGPTSAGVSKISTGKYQYDYTIGLAGPYGLYSDNWIGFLDSFRIEATFNFIVLHTDIPQLNTDGYYHIGDDPGLNFSQIEIQNINKLLKTLRARLNSRGKSKSKDKFNNVIYVDCDIFSVDVLTTFLANSLTMFNEIPHFTLYTFTDSEFVNQFHNVLVEGATLMALASQALIERGLEYNITDSGINFSPPTISELLNTQYSALLTAHQEKVKFIKNSLKPHPIGSGTFNVNAGANPSFARLRHRKQGQII